MKKRLTREQVRELSVCATASKYLRHLPDVVKERPGVPCVLFVRESSESQKDHMLSQITVCEKKLRALGIDCIGVFQVIGSANDLKARCELEKAVAFAREKGAVVVAEATNRFVRGDNYDATKWRDSMPVSRNFKELQQLAGGVTLATILYPDTPEKEVHCHQTKRGMTRKECRGGRPPKTSPGSMKQRRIKALPKVLSLLAQGKSYRTVSEITEIPVMTIHYWHPKRTVRNFDQQDN